MELLIYYDLIFLKNFTKADMVKKYSQNILYMNSCILINLYDHHLMFIFVYIRRV